MQLLQIYYDSKTNIDLKVFVKEKKEGVICNYSYIVPSTIDKVRREAIDF